MLSPKIYQGIPIILTMTLFFLFLTFVSVEFRVPESLIQKTSMSFF